jgi:hypothetical protein
VHGEGLVVGLGAEHLAVGLGELGADQQRLEAADGEEHQRRGAVHDADLLVVDGGDPRAPTGVRRRPLEGAERSAALLASGQLQDRTILGECHESVLYFRVWR